MGKLLPRVDAFCRHYVSNGGNGTKAALSAGYSEKNAPFQASRLLSRPDVKAQIELLRKQYQGLPPPGGNGKPPMNGEVIGPGRNPPPQQPQLSPEETLTRQFLIATGLRNLAMCMGDEDVPVSKAVRYEARNNDGSVTERFEVQTVMVRERNAGAANQALAFLDAQLDKLPRGTDPLGATDTDRRRYLEGMIAEKAAEIRKLVPQKEPAG